MRFRARVDKRSIDSLQEKLANLQSPLSQADAKQIGKDTVDKMKAQIARGISPIRGRGKFPKYINPERYPGKRKPKTPVNLRLKGDFLKDLSYRVVKSAFGFSVSVGYSTQKSRLKERGHREGANGQPERPTIPQDGEQFSASIQDSILIAVRRAVERIRKRK